MSTRSITTLIDDFTGKEIVAIYAAAAWTATRWSRH